MKAIAICGSPRQAGNTEFLLRRCLRKIEEGGIEAEFVPLHGKTIKGCIACQGCGKTKDGTCSVKDDDFGPIFEKIKAAGIIEGGDAVSITIHVRNDHGKSVVQWRHNGSLKLSAQDRLLIRSQVIG